MVFVTLLSRDPALYSSVATVPFTPVVARARSWSRVLWLLRERPITDLVVDSAALEAGADPSALLQDVRRRFPSVGVLFVARAGVGPRTMLRLARATVPGLTLAGYDGGMSGVQVALAASVRRNTSARLLRAMRTRGGPLGRRAASAAMSGALFGWGADDLARKFGWTRAHFGVRLKQAGLPSPGHLLVWARVLHAARWLPERGRTAESVSRQLGYANGAVFRRTLRNYLNRTPSQLISDGGFPVACRAFLDETVGSPSVPAGRVVPDPTPIGVE